MVNEEGLWQEDDNLVYQLMADYPQGRRRQLKNRVAISFVFDKSVEAEERADIIKVVKDALAENFE